MAASGGNRRAGLPRGLITFTQGVETASLRSPHPVLCSELAEGALKGSWYVRLWLIKHKWGGAIGKPLEITPSIHGKIALLKATNE